MTAWPLGSDSDAMFDVKNDKLGRVFTKLYQFYIKQMEMCSFLGTTLYTGGRWHGKLVTDFQTNIRH